MYNYYSWKTRDVPNTAYTVLSVLRKEIHRLYYLYFVTSYGEKNCGKFKKIILLFIIKIICNIGYLNRIFLIRWGQNYMMKALYISGKCTCRQSSCLKTIYIYRQVPDFVNTCSRKTFVSRSRCI